MCDCGLAYTIKRSGFCKKHYGHDVVVDLITKYRTDFNLENLLLVTIFLFTSYCKYLWLSLQGQDSPSCGEVCGAIIEIVDALFYQSPIDVFLLMVTKALFCNLYEISLGDLLVTKLNYIPYQNSQIVIQQFRQKFENAFLSPLIVTIIHA